MSCYGQPPIWQVLPWQTKKERSGSVALATARNKTSQRGMEGGRNGGMKRGERRAERSDVENKERACSPLESGADEPPSSTSVQGLPVSLSLSPAQRVERPSGYKKRATDELRHFKSASTVLINTIIIRMIFFFREKKKRQQEPDGLGSEAPPPPDRQHRVSSSTASDP